ncbi:MAG: hypothetical protein ACP5HX_11525 [Thermoproteota archaeon]
MRIVKTVKSKLNEKVKKLSALTLFELILLSVVSTSILLNGEPLVPSLLSSRWLSILVIFNFAPLVMTILEKLSSKFLARLFDFIVIGILVSATIAWISNLAFSNLILFLFLALLLLVNYCLLLKYFTVK